MKVVLLKWLKIYLSVVLVVCLFFSCQSEKKTEDKRLHVVCTTTMITDLAKQIGGEKIVLEGLMGAGVDPHLYKATEGDVLLLGKANVIFYNGLHLEGKLEDVFDKMKHRDINAVALSDCLSKKDLIASENFASNYDPHIWFNINYWMQVTEYMCSILIKEDPENENYYSKNKITYLEQLSLLRSEVMNEVSKIKQEKRVLVTAHDAFSYFGNEYSFRVIGLQGLSTATEAGVKDMQNLVDIITKKKIRSIFVESSVPTRTIESVQASVRAKGHKVEIGGTLYSDALGSEGTAEGTYIGMYKHNIKTILTAL